MREILSPQFHPWRLAAALFGTFALLALCIAAIGVYSTLSYTTAQRTHEIGVRMALGAQVRDVVRLVLLDGLALVSTGVVIGAIAVVGLSRLLEALVYGTSARDPLTVGVSAMLLLAAAALAGVLPARRAGRVTPMRALRIDS
jgi:ABC-type antimicrobial peptide transport system permease subunit